MYDFYETVSLMLRQELFRIVARPLTHFHFVLRGAVCNYGIQLQCSTRGANDWRLPTSRTAFSKHVFRPLWIQQRGTRTAAAQRSQVCPICSSCSSLHPRNATGTDILVLESSLLTYQTRLVHSLAALHRSS